MPTKIEWVINPDGTPGETINPLIGCKRNCPYCYASLQAQRLTRFPHTKDRYTGLVEEGKWTGTVRFVPSELEKLYRWTKPRSVFIGSMGDVGDSDPLFLHATLNAITDNPRHNCMMLTKNPLRLGLLIGGCLGGREPPPNLMIGATVTDQPSADRIIPLLLDIPAENWFVSYEPALGPVDFGNWIDPGLWPYRRLGWIICGPQNGKGSQPMDPAWARSSRDQCAAAGTSFFYKDGELDGVRHEAMP